MYIESDRVEIDYFSQVIFQCKIVAINLEQP